MRVFRERVFWFDHPDGGRFAVLPAKGDELKELGELVTTEYVTHDGQLVFNAKSGYPVVKQRENVEAVIQRAIAKVKTFEGIREVDDEGVEHELLPTKENLEFLVRNYIGTRSVEVPVKDPKKGQAATETREVPEPLYLWVTQRVTEATEQLRREQRKNS